jgi:hypothetical protein
MPREPALLTSAGRMPERSQHRVSEGQDVRSERPATGHGQPRTVGHAERPLTSAFRGRLLHFRFPRKKALKIWPHSSASTRPVWSTR